jgi:hypothetical protein
MEQIGLLCKEIIKNINMKQLLSLFLFLLPCLALAQYPTNGNQKITLGEQTTADGIIWRGVASDTTLTAKSDTAAYFVLDTVNINFYTYKASATGRKWRQLGADTAAIAYVNTYGTQTINGAKTFSAATTFSSTATATKFIPTDSIKNGYGTYKINTSTIGINVNNSSPFRITETGNWGIIDENPQNLLSTFSSSARGGVISNSYPILMFNEVGNSKFIFGLNANEGYLWGLTNVKLRIATNSLERMRVETSGEVNIGYGATDNGAYLLQVNSQIFATNSTIATSDIRFKENIQPLDKGLEIINKLKPVKFNFISTTENNFSEFDEIGFIAQDVEGALSTELFAKAVVKKLDENKDDSALGLMTEKLIPILVKAIQEQQVQIEALKQEIIILKNK